MWFHVVQFTPEFTKMVVHTSTLVVPITFHYAAVKAYVVHAKYGGIDHTVVQSKFWMVHVTSGVGDQTQGRQKR